MKFCKNCGTQLNDNAGFCPSCGAAAGDAPQQAAAPQQTAPVQPQVLTGDADVQQNKGIAWLSYLGLLLLVPLFARKNSEYCKFHVKQGATLLAVTLAYTIVTEILKAIIRAIFPGSINYSLLRGYYYESSVVTNIFTFLFAAGSIFLSVLAIIGIVNAATGKKNKLFLIGEIPFVETLMDKIYAALNK